MNCDQRDTKLAETKLGNKNIKQHDILYWRYQFTHVSAALGVRDEIRNLRVSLKQKTSQNHRKKIYKMRNLLKMEHSPLWCVIKSRSRRLRPMNAKGRRRRRKELWNQKIQASAAMFLRSSIFDFNSFHVSFSFFFGRREKAVEERQKFSAIWTVHKSRCFSTQPRDRFRDQN